MPRSRSQPTVAAKIASASPSRISKKNAPSPSPASRKRSAFIDDEAAEASNDDEEEEEEEEEHENENENGSNSDASADENEESADDDPEGEEEDDNDDDDDDDGLKAMIQQEVQAISARLREPGEQPREPTAAERALATSKARRKKTLLVARAKRLRKARRVDRFAAREALNLHPHSSLRFEGKPTSWKRLAMQLLDAEGVTLGTDAAAMACRAVLDHHAAQIMPDARDRCLDSRSYKTPDAREEARLLACIQQRNVASAVDSDVRHMHAPLLVRVRQLRAAQDVLEARRARKLEAQREAVAETKQQQHTIELLTSLEKDGMELSNTQRLELVHTKNELHASQLARAMADQQRAKKAIASTNQTLQTLTDKTIPESRELIQQLSEIVIPDCKAKHAEGVVSVNALSLSLKNATAASKASPSPADKDALKKLAKAVKAARTERNAREKALHRYEKALKRAMTQLPEKEARIETLKATLHKQNAALPDLRAKTKQLKKLMDDGLALFEELAREDLDEATALVDASAKKAKARKDKQRAIETVEAQEDDESAPAEAAADMDESE